MECSMDKKKEKKVSNALSPISPLRGSYTPSSSIGKDLLNPEYWLSKELWTEYEIPFLFLGYKPQYGDIYLNAQEDALRERYAELIREAIQLKKLIPYDNRYDYRGSGLAFLSHDVKTWRKTKEQFIKPVQIYLDIEKDIKEPDTADNLVKSMKTTKQYSEVVY
jgi:hypothetical protein